MRCLQLCYDMHVMSLHLVSTAAVPGQQLRVVAACEHSSDHCALPLDRFACAFSRSRVQHAVRGCVLQHWKTFMVVLIATDCHLS